MTGLKQKLFPNRHTALIGGLLALTSAVALIRLTGLAPINPGIAVLIYLTIALTGAATAVLAVRSARPRR